jgi:hypothetical protein
MVNGEGRVNQKKIKIKAHEEALREKITYRHVCTTHTYAHRLNIHT